MSTFDALFVPAELRAAVSDRAWVEAMLDTERALATAEEEAGVIPAGTAASIAACCRGELFDPHALAEHGRLVGNPAEPLVRELRDAVGEEAADYVHWGATSQDIMDTAAMLVARGGLGLIVRELEDVAAACARLAAAHRATPMAARTLLQQAVPTTFGLKAAGWLVEVLDARRRLVQLRDGGLAAELGGAGGTLASFGEKGLEVLRIFAAKLELPEPTLPWHTNRVRIAELGGALDVAAGAMAKIALDICLLAQTEVGEVTTPAGRGGSSTLPQKRNPIGSVLASACARRVHAHASVLCGSLAQEHERAIGAWHAEWDALSQAIACTGGAAAAMETVLAELEVDPERMRSNLDLTHGMIVSERISLFLTTELGRREAHALLTELVAHAKETGRCLRDELLDHPRVSLTPGELDTLLDPTTYLGSAEGLVDRALQRYRIELGVAT